VVQCSQARRPPRAIVVPTMSELRQDPITADWVILSPGRASRPQDPRGNEPSSCPFCPGNEERTGEAIDRIDRSDGCWQVRAVANRFPLLDPSPAAPPAATPLATAGGLLLAGYGAHEVIVETPDHHAHLGVMPAADARQALAMYLRRYRALAGRQPPFAQVVLFRNHGERAGTSLAHPHAQIAAVPVVSPLVRHRVACQVNYFDTHRSCGTCDQLQRELRQQERVVLQTAAFVSLAPFAAAAPYQLHVIPRRHAASLAEIDDGALDDLALHLTRLLGALRTALDDPHYNLVFVGAPLDLVHRRATHWIIDIRPRLTTPAGFEFGAGIAVNSQPPEAAAGLLRAALTADEPH
jgi:UDPglucose--hexose-1-phosphate uridylyltransferase